MKRICLICACALFALGVPLSADDESWTGEVLDLNCYESNGAKGAEHAACALRCIKGGAAMGLLTDDGEVVPVRPDDANVEPYNLLKDLAGKVATVTGYTVEKKGRTQVVVKTAKAAEAES